MADQNLNPVVLEMSGLCKCFPGVQALNEAQIRVRKGTVHALLGENGAGKSTMMNCLFGIYTPDEGEIRYQGSHVSFLNPKQALDDGISMVHQELDQVLEMNVMENIWLGRFPGKFFIKEKQMYEDTRKILDDLNIDVDPKVKMSSLSVSQRQMIEIAKAVSYDAKIIVFDEPTSSLTDTEIEQFFAIIRALKKRDVSMIYISHKLSEIKEIADDLTVLRDGCWVKSAAVKDLSTNDIISLMVGRDLTSIYPPKLNKPSEKVALKVSNLTGTYSPNVQDVSFELREGEILGVAGLMGSRRTELVETLFGLRHLKEGEIILNGKAIVNKTPKEAIKNGFALLTEERRLTGIFADLSVQSNTVASNIDDYCRFLGFLDSKAMERDTKQIIEQLSVKTPSIQSRIANLSGGNQQKVIFGRWLLNDFKVLMLDEPTRGIDVGAKYEIYKLIIDIAKEGHAVIFVSSEMPELLNVSDRILVMSNGRVGGILKASEATQEDILRLSTSYL